MSFIDEAIFLGRYARGTFIHLKLDCFVEEYEVSVHDIVYTEHCSVIFIEDDLSIMSDYSFCGICRFNLEVMNIHTEKTHKMYLKYETIDIY